MNLHDAFDHLSEDPDGTLIFAGGTDLMVQLHAGLAVKKRILDISRIQALKGIQISADSISIGALTSYSQIREHEHLAAEFPMLAAAARATGALAIQNRGTIGGNIANASPAADTPPALLVYDAKIVVGSRRGEREIEYAVFHRGYKVTELKKDEIVLKVILPRRKKGFVDFYEKVGARAAQAISKVGIAMSARHDTGRIHEVRLAFSSVAPTPLRCFKTESVLEGKMLDENLVAQALAQLSNEISPINDIRSDAAYRKHVALNLIKHYLSRYQQKVNEPNQA